MKDEYLEGIMNKDDPDWKPSNLTDQSEGPLKEKKLFPAMVNPIMISDDLAKEFLEWVKEQEFCLRNDDVVNRLAGHIEKQFFNQGI